MKLQILKSILCLLIATLLVNCNSNGKDSTSKTKGKSLSIIIQLPSKEKAIQHIQTHAIRTNQMVSVSTYYYKNVQKKKPCDQIDHDLNRCSGVDAWSKYGYKMVSQKEKTCCRTKKKQVSKIKGNWVATYIAPKDEWSISLEYKDESKNDQQVNWSINLNKSNGLQVSVGS